CSSTTRPASMSSCTADTTSRTPNRATVRSRNSITSSKLCPVSTCSTGNGSGAGQNAFAARCSMTTESLPPENNNTGRSKVAATSRKTCTASASNTRRCGNSYVVVTGEPTLRLRQKVEQVLAGGQVTVEAGRSGATERKEDRHGPDRTRGDPPAEVPLPAQRRPQTLG